MWSMAGVGFKALREAATARMIQRTRTRPRSHSELQPQEETGK